MEFKTMTLAELRGMDTSAMDEVEFAEWLRASAKANNTTLDAKKEQRDADNKADSEAMKLANSKQASKLVSKRSKDMKISYTLKADGSITDWHYGGAIRGAVAANSFKGCVFLIDGQTDILFNADSNLNHGEFNTTDVVKLSSAKRVVLYFGNAVRKNEFRKDGVTKTSEASATDIIKSLDEEEMARVTVRVNGEDVGLADYLKSLE